MTSIFTHVKERFYFTSFVSLNQFFFWGGENNVIVIHYNSKEIIRPNSFGAYEGSAVMPAVRKKIHIRDASKTYNYMLTYNK